MAVDDDNNPAIELGAPIAPWSAADLGVEPGLALYEAAFLIGGTSRLVAVTLARLVARGVLVRADVGGCRILRLDASAIDDAALAPIERVIARAADGFDINPGVLVDVVARDPLVFELRDRLAARGFVHVNRASRQQLTTIVSCVTAPPIVGGVLGAVGVVSPAVVALFIELGFIGGLLVAIALLVRPVHRAHRKSVAALERVRAHTPVRDADLERFLAPMRSISDELQLIVDVAAM